MSHTVEKQVVAQSSSYRLSYRERVIYPELDLIACIKKHACSDPAMIAAHYLKDNQWQTLSYRQLHQNAERYASNLQDFGFKKQDRLVIFSENSVNYIHAMLANIINDAITVTIDPELPEADLLQLLLQSQAHGILVSSQYLKKIKKIAPKGIPIYLLAEEIILQSNATSIPHYALDGNDPHFNFLLFTSGTTGANKGVMLSLSAVIETAQHMTNAVNISSGRMMVVLPMYHIFSLCACIIAPIIEGMELILPSKLDSQSLARALKEKKPNLFPLVPRVLELFKQQLDSKLNKLPGWMHKFMFKTGLLKYIANQKFGGKLQLIICGGAPLETNLQHYFWDLGLKVIVGYGLTESSALICSGEADKCRIGAIGYPPPSYHIKIINQDEQGHGEICVKATNTLLGYFRDNKATQQVLIDSYFHTGDIGYLDQGCLYITDRKKNIIVTSSGKKAYPNLIEQQYKNIPNIETIAVVGLSQANSIGETICAAIKLTVNSDTIKQRVRDDVAKIAANLPSYLQIQTVFFVDTIPENNAKKIKYIELKNSLSRLIQQSTHQDNSEETVIFKSPQQKNLAILIQQKLLLLSQRADSTLYLKTSFTEQGIDSLVLMDLANYLSNEFGGDQWLALFKDKNSIFKISDYIIAHKDTLKPMDKMIDIDQFRTNNRKKPHFLLNQILFCSKLFWRFKIKGRHNIPHQGPYIICANHESHFDVFWLLLGLSTSEMTNIVAIGKQEHNQQWISRYFAQTLDFIPIDRSGDFSTAYYKAKQALNAGKILVIFPEGTRTRDGPIGSFKKATARLALETKTPILPVTITGGFEVFPPQRLLPKLVNWSKLKRYLITLCYGELINTIENPSNVRDLTQQIRDTICEMKLLELRISK